MLLNRRAGRAAAAAIVTGCLVLLAAPASADDGGALGGLAGTVRDTLDPVTPSSTSHPTGAPSAGAAASSKPAPAPSSQDESGANEVADPSTPDHAGAQLLNGSVGGEGLVDAGHNRSTVRDDDSTRADSTLLAVGGEEVAGAHADSRGEGRDTFDPTAALTDQVCDESGQICLSVLYADASATDDGSASHSESESHVATACLGGTEDESGCDAPVSAGLGSSQARASRNQHTGRTTADSQASLADLCLTPPSGFSAPLAAAGCAVGVSVLESHGASDSGGASPSSDRESHLVGLTLGGETRDADTPEAVEVPEGCPEPSLMCAYLNQGETYLGDSVAGHAQDALKVALGVPPTAIAEVPLVAVLGARSETLVHNDGGEPTAATPSDDVRGPGADRVPATVAGVEAGALPNTGGPAASLLAVGLLALGAGAILMAAHRRRMLAGARV